MSYGISIQNTSGRLIISEGFQNFHLVSTGTVSNSGSPPFPTNKQLLFIRPTNFGATIYASTTGGSRYKVNSGSIGWALVEERPPLPSSTFGFRVLTSSGEIAFDSGRRPVRPVLTFRRQGRVDGEGDWATAINLPPITLAGRVRYINSASIRITGIAESGLGFFDYWVTTGATWSSNTSITLSETVSEYNGQAPGGTWFPGWAGTLFFNFADI